MRSFELYLDESGKFADENKAISPSLIGGILVKKDDLSIDKAKNIMEEAVKNVHEKYVHINDLTKINPKLSAKVAVDIMKNIRNIPAHVVVFSNKELLDFKDDKLLYLNIMAEGIVNLLEKLSMEKADPIELNVIAAVRRDLKIDDDKTVIEIEEYSSRIKERIYMKMAEKNLFLSKNCKLNFKLSSARKNPKLMIADVVCNSKLTINSKKFNDEQREILNNIYDSSKYIFSVFKTDIQKKLSEYLIQNNVVDAMFLLNEENDEKQSKELALLIINNINTMPISNLRIQLELLALKIRSIIDVQRNLILCEKFLVKLQNEIIGKIKVKDFIINKLKIDISLYLLTIYTHQGDNENSKKQIEISKKGLREINGSWDFLDYYYILKIREAVFYNTCFNNTKAIDVLTEVIDKFIKLLKIMNEVKEFSNIKSDMVAKAVGTRLQSYTNLITPNTPENLKQEYYEKAVQDSNFAINQFISEMDKRRQYQYRAMLEISMDNFDNAVKYLMKVVGLNEINFDKFLAYVNTITDFSKNFIITNYFIIMQNALKNGNKSLGLKMYDSYKNNKEIYNEYSLITEENQIVFENNNKDIYMHPFEIIYWNLGKFIEEANRDLANKYFDKALEICDKMNEQTIDVLAIAIEADKLIISKNIQNDKQNLLKRYSNIVNNEKYSEINEFLNKFKEEFEIIEISNDDNETIRKACKIIAEEIKV